MIRSGPSAAVPAEEPVLRARDLTKVYRGRGDAVHALRHVDLTVRRGEFVAVMGPSGAGKSTLLHLLGGLDRPDSGEIWLEGRRVDGLSEARWAVLRRSSIGFVFQFSTLVTTMTVADNVELPALLAGTHAGTARERRRELLRELGLEHKARSTSSDLSGGEQQRVALARALVNSPALLLADEPTGSLDSRNTREVLRLLSRFHQRGCTIVVVTHDARVASTADRVLTLFDGEIVDDAAMEDAGPSRPGSVADTLELRG